MARKVNSLQEAKECLEDLKYFFDNNSGWEDEYKDSEDELKECVELAEEVHQSVDTFYGEWEDEKNDDPDRNSGDPDEDDEEDEDEEP